MNLLSKLVGEEPINRCKTIVSTINEALSNVDVDHFLDELMDWEDRISSWKDDLTNEISTLKQRLSFVKNNKTIEVPYDRDTDILECKTENGVFIVCVSGESETLTHGEKHSFTIPFNSCPEGITQRYDKENKVMVFTFNECEDSEEGTTIDENLVNDNAEVTEVSEEERLARDLITDHNNGMSFRALSRKYGIGDKRAARLIRKYRVD